MDRKISIPVRVVRPAGHDGAVQGEEEREPQASESRLATGSSREQTAAAEDAQALATAEAVAGEAEPEAERECEVDEWRDRALRLQADMDNYRKRQQRLAQDQVEAERQRLLGAFLPLVDDLERALAAPASDAKGLRQGVELTHRAAVQMLRKEGVERVQAKNRLFDPNWHEAVATVGRNGSHMEPNTVVEVLEPGYRQGDHLLRPARVVVAV
jgi:molecular chaperone GrpE